MTSTIPRTATLCWSKPKSEPYIITGTVAGVLDATFSSETALEIFHYQPQDPTSLSTPLRTIATSSRFNRITTSAKLDKTYVAGGLENGELIIWDLDHLVSSQEDSEGSSADSVFFQSTNHTGNVSGLEFNPIQTNLLASAGGNGEIFIWDMNNLEKPYTPGARSSKLEDMTCLTWNRQVGHILATSSTTGYTVIWDLKSRRDVMQLSYSVPSLSMGYQPGFGPLSRRGTTAIAWNPDVPTQIVTASEDDNQPVILVWDLRKAQAPERVLSGHTKGVASLSWNQLDSNLLLSGGKDGKGICWNPKTGEILGEISLNSSVFDVQFSPFAPEHFSLASYDNQISFYTLQSKPSSTTAQPFPDDPFSSIQPKPSFHIQYCPKWYQRPSGLQFSSNGKMTLFSKSLGSKVLQKTTPFGPLATSLFEMFESQPDQILQYVQHKLSTLDASSFDHSVYNLLQLYYTHGDEFPKYLAKLLGNEESLISDISNHLQSLDVSNDQPQSPSDPPESTPSNDDDNASNDNAATPEDSTSALFKNESSSDFLANSSSALPSKPLDLGSSDASSTESLITRAILLGNIQEAVALCMRQNNPINALILSICGGPSTIDQFISSYFAKNPAPSYLPLVQAILGHNFENLISSIDLAQWKECLILLLTYTQSHALPLLANSLGLRLLSLYNDDPSSNAEALTAAFTCFFLGGNIDLIMECLLCHERSEQLCEKHILTFVEKVILLRKLPFISLDALDVISASQRELIRNRFNQRLFYLCDLLCSHSAYSLCQTYLSKLPFLSELSQCSQLADQFLVLQSTLEANQFPVEVSFEYSFDCVDVGNQPVSQTSNSYAQETYSSHDSSYQNFPVQSNPAPQPNYANPSQPAYSAQQPYAANTYDYPQQTYQSNVNTYPTSYPQYTTPAAPAPSLSQPPAPPNSLNVPPSQQRNLSAWNDPPIVSNQQRRTVQKATIASPFATSSSTPPPQQAPYGRPHTISPPPPPPSNAAPPQPIYPTLRQPVLSPPPSNSNMNISRPMAETSTPTPPNSAVQTANAHRRPPPNLSSHTQPPPPPPQAQNMQQVPKQVQRPPSAHSNVPPPPNRPQPPQFHQAHSQPGSRPMSPPRGPGSRPMSPPRGQPPPSLGPQRPPLNMPPKSQTPPSQARPSANPQSSQEPAQIPPAHRPIAATLQREFARLKQAGLPQQKRLLDDTEKRLNQLFAALARQQLSSQITSSLLELCHALDAKDIPTAQKVIAGLVSANFDGVGPWFVGVRRIVDLLRSM